MHGINLWNWHPASQLGTWRRNKDYILKQKTLSTAGVTSWCNCFSAGLRNRSKFELLTCCYVHYTIKHHHHVVPLARISLTLFRHFSLSFIASGRSSGLHPVSSHSCCMYIRASRPAFTRTTYVGVHRSTSLMSSSLLLQQCSACLVRLTRIVFVMGDRWPYSWCLVGCCRQELFNIARNILV